MSQFPTTQPTFTDLNGSATLAANSHSSRHNIVHAELGAVALKVGTGASTPTASTVLLGTGTGTSGWGQVPLTTSVTGTLPTANGGTGTTSTTGTGANAYGTAPTISNPTITGGGSWAGSPIITTPTIASLTNMQHTHGNAAGGGQLVGSTALTAGSLTAAIMKFGMMYRRQGGSATDWSAAGTTNFDVSALDLKIQGGTMTVAGTNTDNIITFPVAFTQTPIIICTPYGSSGVYPTWYIVTQSATGFNFRAGANVQGASWVAMGI